jgi:hypothetical protein
LAQPGAGEFGHIFISRGLDYISSRGVFGLKQRAGAYISSGRSVKTNHRGTPASEFSDASLDQKGGIKVPAEQAK